MLFSKEINTKHKIKINYPFSLLSNSLHTNNWTFIFLWKLIMSFKKC